MNGGYIMISKASKKIYNELFTCLTLGKPILWYENDKICYFIDTISGGEITTEIVDDEEVITYGDIILTKGSMTITITSENVVTEEGKIQPSSAGSSLHPLKISAFEKNTDEKVFLVQLIINVADTTINSLSALQNYLIDNGYKSGWKEDLGHYIVNGLACVGVYQDDSGSIYLAPNGITATLEDGEYGISLIVNNQNTAEVDGHWLYADKTYTFEYLDA